MPAAAVIPAPIAYIKVVAVETLVVESQHAQLVSLTGCTKLGCSVLCGVWVTRLHQGVTLRKFECFKQAYALKTPAWNDK